MSQAYFNPNIKEKNPMLRGIKPIKEKEYLTDAFGREAVAFIDKNKQKPFFLYLSFNAPHGPLQAPPKYTKKYPDISDPKRKKYAAMVSAIDENVGRLLAKLRTHNIEKNTLIFFLSDHGGVSSKKGNWASNKPLRAGKGTLYEGGVRTLFLLQWKDRLPQGKSFNSMISSMDILPTCVAAGGGKIDPRWELDGVNLLHHLKHKKNKKPHDTLYWRINEMWAVISEDWKLIKERGPKTQKPKLFNLAEDSAEKNNIASQHPEKVKNLRKLYERWDKQLEKPRFGWWKGVGPRIEKK